MARAKQPVSINGIEFDALIDSDEGYKSNVPSYAVETGFSVSDAIIIESEVLSMTLYVTNTPVTWHKQHGGDQNRVDSVVAQLKELYFTKETVTVTTSDGVYTDMAIETFNVKKSVEIGYAREIPISFKKVRITEAETTTIPDSYGKSGKTGAQAGNANTSTGENGDGSGSSSGSGSSDSDSENRNTILWGAANKLGLWD